MPQSKARKPAPLRAGVVPKKAATRNADQARKNLTAKGTRRRDNLKAAALAALEKKGYRALRLTDVAREAGVNISLVYHYFTDKAELVFEALRDVVDTSRVMRDREDRPRDPFEALFDANRIFAEFYRDHPGLMRAIVHFDEENPEFHKLYSQGNREWTARIAGNIAKRCPKADFTEAEATTLAYALGGMGDKFLFELYVERVPELVQEFDSVEKAARFLAIMWYRALYLENPPPKEMAGFDKIEKLRLGPDR